MKKFLILLLLALFSCIQEPILEEEARPSRTSPRYFISRGYATDYAMGFRSSFAVVKTSSGNGTNSYWASGTFLLADGRKGWIQAGVHDNKPFYQTPDAFPYTQPFVNGVVINQMPTLGSNMTVTFYINSQGYPTLNMDGVDVCYWPVQAVAVIDGDVAVESYPKFYGNFPTVIFNKAFEFLKEGVWVSPTTSISRGGGYGMIGSKQDPSLPDNVIKAGGAVPFTNNGDILFE
jgi:hypothetical protein